MYAKKIDERHRKKRLDLRENTINNAAVTDQQASSF